MREERIMSSENPENERQVDALVSSGIDPIYVLEGPEEGWHNFKTYNDFNRYAEHLIKADYDFIVNPNW